MFYKIAGKILPSKSLRRKARAKYNAQEHQKLAKYLQKNYIQAYLKGKLKTYNLKAKNITNNENIAWQFWAQGKQNAPQLVKACFDSVRQNLPTNYKQEILDLNTISNFIELPDFVNHRLENGFKFAAFSDLLRVALLYEFGGVWIDATIFISDNIEDILKNNFFAFNRTEQKPQNADFFINKNPNYFSWDKNFLVRFLSSFIVCKKHHNLALALRDILLNYWENEKEYKHYFLFQIIFELLKRENFNAFLDFKESSDLEPHLLQFSSKEIFNAELWENIKKQSKIHKLTYFKDLQKDSMLGKILNL